MREFSDAPHFDPVSYLLGQKSVKPEPVPDPPELPVVRKVSYYGDGNATAATSIQVVGLSSSNTLISVMHRDDLTAPEDCVLLDKSTYTTGQGTQYVSVFKRRASTAALLTFTQASSARIAATAWAIGYPQQDFSLEKLDTQAFELFTGFTYERAKDFLFATVSSLGSTGSTTVYVDADSKNFWLNAPSVLGVNQTVLRHFTGIHFPSDNPIDVTIGEKHTGSDTFNTMGQAVIYKIVKA